METGGLIGVYRGINNNVQSYYDTKNITEAESGIIPEQGSGSQSNEISFNDVYERVSLLRQHDLNNNVSTLILKTPEKSEIGGTVNLVMGDGKILSAKDLSESFNKDQNCFIEIKSSDLNPAGQKYQNAHNCESIA